MSESNNTTQILLAIIGLTGALGGAVIANWDKLAPQLQVPSTGAVATGSVASDVLAGTKEIKNAGPSVGPSFDCAKATHRSELLICSSPELAVLDLAMANAYREAASHVRTREGKAALRDLQNHWLRRVREACADAECLKAAYEQRIRELNAVQL